MRSQILCQPTAKMMCGLKSLTLKTQKLELFESHKFERVD